MLPYWKFVCYGLVHWIWWSMASFCFIQRNCFLPENVRVSFTDGQWHYFVSFIFNSCSSLLLSVTIDLNLALRSVTQWQYFCPWLFCQSSIPMLAISGQWFSLNALKHNFNFELNWHEQYLKNEMKCWCFGLSLSPLSKTHTHTHRADFKKFNVENLYISYIHNITRILT